jgi:large subunit ribosomal protein L14e
MVAIEIGRVCIKTAGREAGEKCEIVDIIDSSFVEVKSVDGSSIKNRRCNINHLEPIADETEEVEGVEEISASETSEIEDNDDVEVEEATDADEDNLDEE